ncbi:MAG: diacylglycerol/lipid kinase family protein [Acidimicrobiia bacterium]
MMRHVVLVVNPSAGRGKVAMELDRLLASMARLSPRLWETRQPGDASALARKAAEGGADVVVAVGGDGTVNEVVNGLIDGDRPVGSAALAVVAAGSGCDFARSFDLPGHVPDSIGLDQSLGLLDVGKIECDGPAGRTVRYFVNVAEAGLGAATVANALRFPRRLGRSRYIIAFWPTLARFHPQDLTVTVDGRAHRETAHNVVVANARFFGGGMHISPRSHTDDGKLEVQVSIGPKRQAFTLIPRIYRGTHLPDDRILEMSGSVVRIEGATMPVEADGEMVGATPATISVLPGLLELVA